MKLTFRNEREFHFQVNTYTSVYLTMSSTAILGEQSSERRSKFDSSITSHSNLNSRPHCIRHAFASLCSQGDGEFLFPNQEVFIHPPVQYDREISLRRAVALSEPWIINVCGVCFFWVSAYSPTPGGWIDTHLVFTVDLRWRRVYFGEILMLVVLIFPESG